MYVLPEAASLRCPQMRGEVPDVLLSGTGTALPVSPSSRSLAQSVCGDIRMCSAIQSVTSIGRTALIAALQFNTQSPLRTAFDPVP